MTTSSSVTVVHPKALRAHEVGMKRLNLDVVNVADTEDSRNDAGKRNALAPGDGN